MKRKPILTAIASMAVLIICFSFTRDKRSVKPDKAAIIKFLNAFNVQIKAGNIDSAESFFKQDIAGTGIEMLGHVMGSYRGSLRKTMLAFDINFDTRNAQVKFTNNQVATAMVIARFSTPGIKTQISPVLFTIEKNNSKQYKISSVDLRNFNQTYSNFGEIVRSKSIPEKYLYKPITLAAFKNADKLKKNYDGVLWFDHINDQTYYYVYRGTVPYNLYDSNARDRAIANFQMGLVNPDLKEIIPVSYDLIRSVGGTVSGLIEVEKNTKKGLYNLNGKVVVPADYDEIYPLKENANVALLKKGTNYYYLKRNFIISPQLNNFNIAEHLALIKAYGQSFTLSAKSQPDIMEENSRKMDNAIYIAPSYLADWKIIPDFTMFVNPLRKVTSMASVDLFGPTSVRFDHPKKEQANSWYERMIYTIGKQYLGGRSGLYSSKTVVLADKRKNKTLSFEVPASMGDGYYNGLAVSRCNESDLLALSDSLFQYKITSEFAVPLTEKDLNLLEAPYYHFIQIKGDNIIVLKTSRIFPTKFNKLDDSYLQGCYTMAENSDQPKNIRVEAQATAEILEYMKNEIYASYHYHFKDEKWNTIFKSRFDNEYVETPKNDDVKDSLTVIDKYNINFINAKLKAMQPKIQASR